MATQPTKLTNDERKVISDSLTLHITSLNRSAKTAKADTIRQAFEKEANAVSRLLTKVNNGELEL